MTAFPTSNPTVTAARETNKKTRQGSAWPFYLVVLTNLWCHLLFPLRFFSEAGVTALASHRWVDVYVLFVTSVWSVLDLTSALWIVADPQSLT